MPDDTQKIATCPECSSPLAEQWTQDDYMGRRYACGAHEREMHDGSAYEFRTQRDEAVTCDLIIALRAERDALRAEVERLRALIDDHAVPCGRSHPHWCADIDCCETCQRNEAMAEAARSVLASKDGTP